MKKTVFLFSSFLAISLVCAQSFLNPLPQKDVRTLERTVMKLYYKNKDCNCRISKDSITIVSIYWVGYDTDGYIDKNCFISLEFSKHIIPLYQHYKWHRLLYNYTFLFDYYGTSLGFSNGWSFSCSQTKLKGDNIIDSEKLYNEIMKHEIEHIFQIYNFALGELIGISKKGEVFLISGFASMGNHLKVAKVQNIPDDYWIRLFEKPERPATRPLLYQIELLEEQ